MIALNRSGVAPPKPNHLASYLLSSELLRREHFQPFMRSPFIVIFKPLRQLRHH